MPSAVSTAIENRLRNSTPYSSTVLVRDVATRQFAASRLYVGSPWLSTGADPLPSEAKTPSTVFVFPTSMTSNIVERCPTPYLLPLPHRPAQYGLHPVRSLQLQ